jgi:protein-disulfide isomerase
MREIWFVALMALTFATVQPAAADSPKPSSAVSSTLLSLSKEDRILGKPDAPITIVEYASLSCPHCAEFEKSVLPPLQKKWIDTGKAKLVLRDFPLDGPALQAAVLARCVPANRFYPFVETLFGAQEEWVLAKDQKAALARIARLGGVGPKEFDTCMSNKGLQDQVAQSRLVASQQLNVGATPTFFINGTKFEGAPTQEALDQALTAAAAKS